MPTQPLSTSKQRRRVYLLLSVTTLLSLITLGWAYLTQQRIQQVYATIDRELKQGQTLTDLLSALQDAETGQRGYLLTHDTAYLAPYQDALVRLPAALAAYRQNGPPGRANENVGHLDSLISAKLDELDITITLTQAGRDSAALRIVKTNQGRQIMEAFRASIAELRQHQQERIEAAIARAERLQRLMSAARISVVILLGLLVYFLFTRLRKLILNLEHTVAERDRKIEERQRVEQQNERLIHTLRTKNEDLDHFAYIASHDLQEPLRTVNNFIEVFREEYGDRLDKQAEMYFGFLLGATERMRILINNLLNFSHIGRSNQREPVDLNVTLNEVRANLHLVIQETGAEIEQTNLPTVQGFAIELFQLFQNLLTNALKFTRPGQAPQVSIFCTETDAYYRIGVEDQGIGMSEANQKKIFRMFSRVNHPDDFAGEGIGLAFCRKITELHGGNLTVESTLGRGSTFYITLPRTVENEEEVSQNPPG